jgi:hypothetical protein
MALRAPRETEPFDQTLANMKHGRQRELLFSNGNDCHLEKEETALASLGDLRACKTARDRHTQAIS